MAVVDSDGKTKAVIEVPDGTRYEVFAPANPNRVVVDLHQSRLADDFRVPGPDGVVANVRTGEPNPGDVRLVFDLAAKVRPKSYFQHEDGKTELVIEMQSAGALARGALSRSGAAKPVHAEPAAMDAIATRPDPTGAGTPASTPVALSTDPSPSVAPLDLPVGGPTVSASVPDQGAVSQPVAAIAGASSRYTATESRPGGSPSMAAPQTAQGDLETADAEQPRPVNRPGARTLRDVLGTGQRKIVIAVDPGHGGKDTGACGYNGSYEKNVTLATARELARQIDAEPGMKAVLTRDGDYFVPLAERYHKAREAKADLFISIHADADPTHTATGSSVWVLSERGVTSQAAKWLADRENAADLVGGVKLSDKDDTLASVLLDLSQSATMKASEDAAERVHQALRDIGRTHKAHPERANFVVLRSPDVPSMLVETAFITNEDEERHLNDSEYRARLASAVLSGVKGYFIDNPLPGTELAALHERGSRNTTVAYEASRPRMVATSIHASDDDPAATAESAQAGDAPVELATADDSRRYHIVQPGERLLDIANEYGVSVLRLSNANGLQGNQIHPGQRLRIPARSNSG